MWHKSNNKTRPLFTLSLEMTRLVNETRLLLVPCLIRIYTVYMCVCVYYEPWVLPQQGGFDYRCRIGGVEFSATRVSETSLTCQITQGMVCFNSLNVSLLMFC